MGDISELDATIQMRWQSLQANAHTIEASFPRGTIVPPTVDPSTTGRRAVARLLAKHPEKSMAGVLLEGTLGEGGMGVVRLGTQRSLGRKVAVKTLRADHRGDAAVLKLLREAWITGSLEHPNILPIHDVSLDDDGMPLVVLKRIEGIDWSEVISDAEATCERFGVEDALEHHLKTFIQVCHAVAFAHSRGIVHRDIKPDNVRIGEFGEVYVLDWGIAVALQDDGTGRFPLASKAFEMAGTPNYMAPEMLGEEDVPRISERTDVYLLGATLHEILAGRPPHEGKKAIAIVTSVLKSKPALPDDAPEELAEIVRRCMQLEPDDRYESAEAVRVAVERYLQHRGSIALARTAATRADELESIVEHAKSDSEARVAAYDAFGECRFGCQQALQTWAGNDLAREGLRRAVLAMIDLELSRGEARAAARFAEELDGLPDNVAERLSDGLRAQEEREQHLAELEQLGKQHDPSIGTRTRSFVSAVFAITWTVAPIFGHFYIVGDKRESYSTTLTLLVAALLLAAGLGRWARESLSKTVINRRLGGVTMLMLSLLVAGELGGWMLGVPTAHIEVFFFLLWAFTVGVFAITMNSKLTPAALVYVLGFFAAARWPDYRLLIMAGTNFFAALNFLIVWRPEVWFEKRTEDVDEEPA